jgi:predicted transcriptional regulator
MYTIIKAAYIAKINYGSLKPRFHNFISFSEVLLLQVFHVANTRIKCETQNIIHVRKQYNDITQNQQNLHLNHNQMNEVHL